MTRADFLEKYRLTMIGGFLYGAVTELQEGPLVRAAHAHRIPAQVERLLNGIFNDLVGPDQPKPATGNGQAQPTGKVQDGQGNRREEVNSGRR